MKNISSQSFIIFLHQQTGPHNFVLSHQCMIAQMTGHIFYLSEFQIKHELWWLDLRWNQLKVKHGMPKRTLPTIVYRLRNGRVWSAKGLHFQWGCRSQLCPLLLAPDFEHFCKVCDGPRFDSTLPTPRPRISESLVKPPISTSLGVSQSLLGQCKHLSPLFLTSHATTITCAFIYATLILSRGITPGWTELGFSLQNVALQPPCVLFEPEKSCHAIQLSMRESRQHLF